jgi:hypothetical protein
MQAKRIVDNPIITPGMNARMCEHGHRNINGPSLIAVPDWVSDPLGRYYLYFAHHQGTYIRLAYADAVTGPYTMHDPGVLPIGDTPISRFERGHIASPDLHVDHEGKQLVMYYHGCPPLTREAHWDQPTFRATSSDGLNWTSETTELGESYFRVFAYDGAWYAIAKGGLLYRSADGVSGFELREQRIDSGEPGHGRHFAVRRTGDTLHVWFSRWHDTPERIVYATMDLRGDWRDWKLTEPTTLLTPEHDWEGANEPIRASQVGAVHKPVHELRDPAIFEEDGRLWLVYSVAGESGLALAELVA